MNPLLKRLSQVAQRQPDHPALIETDGSSLSYGAFWNAIQEMADMFKAQGVQPNDRLAIVSENAIPACVGFFAALMAGAWIVPVNARLTATELDRILDHAAPRLILFTSDHSNDAKAHAKRMGALGWSGSFGAVQVRCCEVPIDTSLAPQDIACLVYTSGTTGDPKGVMLSHGNLIYGGDSAIQRRNLTKQDLLYAATPLTHILGLSVTLIGGLLSGATLLLEPRFTVEKAIAAIEAGITVFSTVPLMHARIIDHAQSVGVPHMRDRKVRLTSSGGAPLDIDLKRRVEAFYGAPMQNGYGMTETTASTSGTQNAIGSDDVSVGVVLPGVDLQIDHDVAGGDARQSVGEVLVRGPQVMQGYYKNPEATAQVMTADGFLRSGDLGRIDRDGNLHLVGRCKELIIRGGFNVYPQDVEMVLLMHPDVSECAVIGRPIENGDEEILAFVQPIRGTQIESATLFDLCRQNLARYKVPSHIIIAETLPSSPTGKLLKKELPAVFEALSGNVTTRGTAS